MKCPKKCKHRLSPSTINYHQTRHTWTQQAQTIHSQNLTRLTVLVAFLSAASGCGGILETGASDATELTGVWQGTYTCAQGLTGLKLVLTGKASGELDAVFNFHEVPRNPGVPSGSFLMNGTFGENRTVKLFPGNWIEHPAGYMTVGLDGVVSMDSQSITGTVPECNETFHIER